MPTTTLPLYLSFCDIPELHDNTPHTTSPLGEQSRRSLTFAKDPETYIKENTPVIVNCYWSKNDTTPVAIPQALADKEVEICGWILQQAIDGNFNSSSANCLQQLQTTFTAGIEWIDVGIMITDSSMFMPAWIHAHHIDDQSNKHEFKIWFNNEHFEDEYPFREISTLQPIPVDDIDFLMEHNYQEIQTRLNEETLDKVEARINVLTDGSLYPYTARLVYAFDIIDTINNVPVKGYWTALLWGNVSDAEDDIFEAFRQCILTHSQYPEEQWAERVPDLFNPLEFTIIPYWDRKGKINKTDDSSTFSPITDIETDLVNPKKYLPTFTEEQLIKSMQIVPTLTLSLASAFVAKENNREGYEKVSKIYPDYSLIPSTDAQFGTMDPITTEFIKGLQTLLTGALVINPLELPPPGVKKLVRNDVLYASKKIGNINYICVSYYQFVQDGIITNDQ